MNTRFALPLFVALVVAGAVFPAAALDGLSPPPDPASVDDEASNDSGVEVGTGQQLSTVISATSEEVQSDFESTAFAYSLNHSQAATAAVLADHGDRLHRRAVSLRAEYEATVRAYERGEIARTDLAREIGLLHAQAEHVQTRADELFERAESVPDERLREAGLNLSELHAAVDRLDTLRGEGPKALLERFTGDSEGDVDVEVDDGVSVEASDPDGRQVRNVERSGDEDDGVSVTRSEALSIARDELSERDDGEWVMAHHESNERTGTYTFAFWLEADGTFGAAVATVDGSAGTVTSLEEVTHPTPEDAVESTCRERLLTLRAELEATLRAADSPEERTEIRDEFEDRIESVREECRTHVDDGDGNETDDGGDGNETHGDGSEGIDRADALSIARDALSDVEDGRWTLEGSFHHASPSGNDTYEFVFRLEASEQFGITRIQVDAGSGAVVSVEERNSDAPPDADPGEGDNETDTGDERLSRDRAVSIASDALSSPAVGNWTFGGVTETETTYAVIFELDADGASGTARVEVDAHDGTVLAVSEHLRDHDSDDSDVSIDESEAASIARDALAGEVDGTLEIVGLHLADGAYLVEFVAEGDASVEGALVEVDAETGDVLGTRVFTDDGETIDEVQARSIARNALAAQVDGTLQFEGLSLSNGVYEVRFLVVDDAGVEGAVAYVHATSGDVLETRVFADDGGDQDGINESEAVSIAHDALSSHVEGSLELSSVSDVHGDYGVNFTAPDDPDVEVAGALVDGETGAVLDTRLFANDSDDGDDGTAGINESEAVSIARDALSSVVVGTLELSSVTDIDGDYGVNFTAPDDPTVDAASALVDAETGAVLETRVLANDSDDGSTAINESEAVSIARDALSDQVEGTLELSSVSDVDGDYGVNFTAPDDPDVDVAGALVDAETGDVLDTRLFASDGGDTINASEAESIARDALSTEVDGTLEYHDLRESDGVYAVGFAVENDADLAGAVARVDAETGDVLGTDTIVSLSVAEASARENLSDVDGGTWVLVDVARNFDFDGGHYALEFDLDHDTENGTAYVEVDAFTGAVLEVWES